MKVFGFLGLILVSTMMPANSLLAANPQTIVYNIEQNEHQSVLVGPVDTLFIVRGNAEFYLGPGELSLFDFGSGRIAAMAFQGQGSFIYAPPDEVERYQLRKFTGANTLQDNFGKFTVFFTVELEPFPDTANFARMEVGKSSWKQLHEFNQELFKKLGNNVDNRIMGDLLADGPGTYFCAGFETEKSGNLIFEENPLEDDMFRFYRIYRNAVGPDVDVLSGYSPENDLPSQRGVVPIDIYHYDIKSIIEGGGKMMVDCAIHYVPTRWGRQFFFLKWYNQNKPIAVLGSQGDSLYFVNSKDEPGIGIVLNQPMELGQKDSVTIKYQCKSLDNLWGIYYVKGQTYWYPRNEIRDDATYDLSYVCPKGLQVISCGDSIEAYTKDDNFTSKWRIEIPAHYTSFNVGNFETKTVTAGELPPVHVYLSNNIPHAEIALYLAYYGELSSANMTGRVGADVTNSMAFYTSLFGECPFKTIRVTEIPAFHGQGSPGLIHLSWGTFQQESISGSDEQFRAHEVAHQWWGHVVDNESYRDTWIIEGLAEYCGLWFYQMSSENTGNCNRTLKGWQQALTSGDGVNSVGSKAGPVTVGYRLASTKSSDYGVVVYDKGAYIFHMIRYLLHDFETNSDDAFAAFLKDLAEKYKGKIITTEKLRILLEEHISADMTWFFDQWVYGTAIPKYTFSHTTAKTADGKFQTVCHVKQEEVPPNFQMLVPVTVLFEGDKYVHFRFVVDQPEVDIELPLLPYEPKKVIFNTYSAVLCEVDND
jgi:hypothetical protein